MREGKEIHHELQTFIVLKGHCSPSPQNKHERNTFHEVLYWLDYGSLGLDRTFHGGLQII